MLLKKLFFSFVLICLVRFPASATLASPKPSVQKLFQSIKIFPAEVVLGSRRSGQRIVVQGLYADGYSEDITAKAKVSVGDA